MIIISAAKAKIGLFQGGWMCSNWKKVPLLEKKYVHESYDIIAKHFSHSRFAIWPKVKHFL